MPVKRRATKRRVDPAREYMIWESVLTSGRDFFHELHELGVTQDEHGPEREPALTAWLTHGPRIVAERDPSLWPAWAEEEFGRPWEVEACR